MKKAESTDPSALDDVVMVNADDIDILDSLLGHGADSGGDSSSHKVPERANRRPTPIAGKNRKPKAKKGGVNNSNKHASNKQPIVIQLSDDQSLLDALLQPPVASAGAGAKSNGDSASRGSKKPTTAKRKLSEATLAGVGNGSNAKQPSPSPTADSSASQTTSPVMVTTVSSSEGAKRRKSSHPKTKGKIAQAPANYPIKPDEELYRKRVGISANSVITTEVAYGTAEKPNADPNTVLSPAAIASAINGGSGADAGPFSVQLNRPKRRKSIGAGTQIGFSEASMTISHRNRNITDQDRRRKSNERPGGTLDEHRLLQETTATPQKTPESNDGDSRGNMNRASSSITVTSDLFSPDALEKSIAKASQAGLETNPLASCIRGDTSPGASGAENETERVTNDPRVEQGSTKNLESMINGTVGKDLFDVLTARHPGYLMYQKKTSGSATSAEGAAGDDTDASTIQNVVLEGTASQSLPMSIRQFYVSKVPPKASTTRPLLDDEVKGKFFVTNRRKDGLLRMVDGEIAEVIDPSCEDEGAARSAAAYEDSPDVSVDQKARVLFGGKLGSGQSIEDMDKVIEESKEKLMDSNSSTAGSSEDEDNFMDGVCTKEEAVADAFINPGSLSGTIGRDTIISDDNVGRVFPATREASIADCIGVSTGMADDALILSSACPKKPHGSDSSAMIGQEYLYGIRHEVEEMGEIIGQFNYKEHFGMPKRKLDSIPQFYPNIAKRKRADEESYLRQPVGKERPCAQEDACEGNFICPGGFTLTEFPNIEDSAYFRIHGRYPEDSRPNLCVLCARSSLVFLFFYVHSFCQAYKTSMIAGQTASIASPGETHSGSAPDISTLEKFQPLMLCNFTNLIGPGEYAPGNCLMSGSSKQYKALAGAILVNNKNRYKLKVYDGVKWYIQHYPKPMESPSGTLGSSSSGVSGYMHGKKRLIIPLLPLLPLLYSTY